MKRTRPKPPGTPQVPPAPPGRWRVAVGAPGGPATMMDSEYDYEAAARHAAKLVGGGSVFIVRPDGTRYIYVRQPTE